jgi:hypothetical protein
MRGTVGKLKKITDQMKKEKIKKLCDKEIDQTLTNVIKGKFKRRGY